ncbi:trypsin-like peptidase domain-containing protein [Rummeliibacillus pycnus]|uniref:trypsin-like peptidase domain-containing protein n=1 Tax=Rummeliibacillus pycnus TaxID=101070 RepID=UPI003D29188F
MKYKKLILLCLMSLLFCTFQATSVEAAKIQLVMNKTNYSMYVNGKQQIKVTVKGTKQSKVKWKTSNSTIANVNSKGVVSAKKVGKVNITAYIPNTKVKAIAKINISKKILNSQEVFKKVNPAVVYIALYNKYNQHVSSGSGFIVNSNGTIVTNHHVVTDISEAKYVKISLSDGRVYETNQVIGYDAKRDLAVLKIKNAKNLPTVQLGDSNKIETGEKVYALGSPLGSSGSITEGILSNKQVVLNDKQRYIQSSAPISHGNSGGTLVNKYGEVIGINVASLVSGQNMNLAIPINDYKKMNLKKYNTLINVNREYYVPLSGEGKVYEEENNDDLEYADYIKYKRAWINGKVASNNDVDVYQFNLTDYATVNITCLTADPNISDNLSFGLFDDYTEKMEWATQKYDSTNQTYYTTLTKKLSPGTYYIVIAPYSDADKTFSNSSYGAFLEITN